MRRVTSGMCLLQEGNSESSLLNARSVWVNLQKASNTQEKTNRYSQHCLKCSLNRISKELPMPSANVPDVERTSQMKEQIGHARSIKLRFILGPLLIATALVLGIWILVPS